MAAKTSKAAGTDSKLYWYVNGEKQEYNFDPNNMVVQGKAEALNKVGWANKSPQILNVETYEGKQLVSLSADQLNHIDTDLEVLIPVYEPGNDQPILLDDRIMVTFNDPLISTAEVLEFADKHELVWINQDVMNLPAGGVYTYLFEMAEVSVTHNSASLSARLFEQESALIRSAQPNRVNHAKVNGDAIDNPNFQKSWHLQNTGQQLFCTQNSGSQNADVNVVKAWDAGFKGQGIRVAVIDVGGFEFNHPDMQGQFLPGWDCVNNQPYDASNAYMLDPNQAHGMNVAGIIGAKGNAIGATGVAYDAKLVPLLISGSESTILIALQKALEMDVDVINMSFGTGYSEAVELQIENLVNLGRVRYGNTYGTIIVASHGNDGKDDDAAPQWPSAYAEVLSVTANTPDDKLKKTSDNWNVSNTWAANYGNKLDLTAPGVCVYTTDLMGSGGYSSTDYGGLQKTSAASPIVAGVAALLLSKNSLLTWQEVREKLLSTAQKAHTNEYNYNHDASRPGHSKEMGYGRVNAFGAMEQTAVGIDKPSVQPTTNNAIVMNTLVTDRLELTTNVEDAQDITMQVVDMTGKLIRQETINGSKATVDVSSLPGGIYLATFIAGEREILETKRFMKAH